MLQMQDGKVCSKCKVFKHASMFSKNTRSKIGLQSKCKQCVSELQKKDLKHKKHITKKIKKRSVKKVWNGQQIIEIE